MQKIIEPPIKTLQMIHGTGVSGPGRVLYGLAKALDRNEFSMDVLCPGKGALAEELAAIGIKIIPFEPKRMRDPAYMLKVIIRLRKEGYLVFNCHSGFLNLFSRVMGRLLGVPAIIFTEHQVAGEHIWIKTKMRLFFHNLLHRVSNMMVDSVITVSNATKASYIKRQGIREDKVFTVYNGIDTEELKYIKGDAVKFRTRWGIPRDAFIVGIVARIDREKDHATLVRAAKEILAKRPETRFLVVGEGEERGKVERLIKESQAAERFIMTGFQKNPYELMDVMDIVVQPSLLGVEAFGLTLVEAMVKGKAVVATDIRCFNEIVTNGEDGLLFRAEDHHMLAGKILALMGDKDLRQKLGAAARDKVIKNFDIKIMAGRVQQVYKETLSRKGYYLKDDYLKKAAADFIEYANRGMGLSRAQDDARRTCVEKYINFVKDKKLDETEVRRYLEREDNFTVELFLRFLDKKKMVLDETSDFNNRLFEKALRGKAVTAKDYDERILMQTIPFQIDNYYDPKDAALRRRVDIILSFLSPRPGDTILDVGCGVGTFAYHSARMGARACGVDYSSESIAVAKRLAGDFGVSGRVEFICCDAAGRLPYADASFDKAVAADFMEHIDDTQKRSAIAEISRVVKPGGDIIVFTPNAVRESIGALKNALAALFGFPVSETRLHYGLTDRFSFESMLRAADLAFERRFFDPTRPYLGKIPLLNELLSLDILWAIKNRTAPPAAGKDR